jgi:DNA mismatch endonuclease (patch repair protein)
MADTLSPAERSARMALIRSKNTKPEFAVRQAAHRLGYRFRLHRADLPGKPDLAFPSRRKVIFVHGCFWHQHDAPGCKDARPPRSNEAYWRPKLARNVARDAEHIAALKASGWGVLVIWDCETKQPARLADRLRGFLGPKAS